MTSPPMNSEVERLCRFGASVGGLSGGDCIPPNEKSGKVARSFSPSVTPDLSPFNSTKDFGLRPEAREKEAGAEDVFEDREGKLNSGSGKGPRGELGLVRAGDFGEELSRDGVVFSGV